MKILCDIAKIIYFQDLFIYLIAQYAIAITIIITISYFLGRILYFIELCFNILTNFHIILIISEILH